jgi:hypothetical protein
MTDLVREGQISGEMRAGDPRALAHLASVLTNEFVLADLPLTRDEFHAAFDGTLRAPPSDPNSVRSETIPAVSPKSRTD